VPIQRHLFDANVFLAASIEAHVNHVRAREWVESIVPPSVLGFCRVTEMACLRLLTQPIAEGFQPLTNRDAAAVYLAWRQDDRVDLMAEPPGLAELWPRLALRNDRSPKLWTDAYLAAFAITGRCRLVTFDAAFHQFEGAGLDLLHLEPE
jgi:toxin-antitoxin system PIN domain toxin